MVAELKWFNTANTILSWIHQYLILDIYLPKIHVTVNFPSPTWSSIWIFLRGFPIKILYAFLFALA